MHSAPLVSVIIPTYNRIDYLVEAIDSVLAQTYAHYEVLVADDGSTDGTADRLRQYGSPVRHLRLEHVGRPSATRNRALAVARGDLVAFLDDDDIWLPTKLERQVELLHSERDFGMAYTNVRFLDDDGSQSDPVLQGDQLRHGHVFDDLMASCFIHPSTVVIRRDIGERIGWFEESLECIEDFDLWLRVSYDTLVGVVREPVAFVRRHASQISRERERATQRNMPVVLHRIREHGPLSWRQRLLWRRALSRAHTQLAIMPSAGKKVDRRRLMLALQLNPLNRRAWRNLLRL